MYKALWFAAASGAGIFSSPCMKYKCRPGMRALFMHHWPRSTAKQFFAAKKNMLVIDMHHTFGNNPGCCSSPPLFHFTNPYSSGLRKQGLPSSYSSFSFLWPGLCQTAKDVLIFLNKTGECFNLGLSTELCCVNAYEHWLLNQFRKIK